MALADFALPAAIIGGFFLIRELKDFDPSFGFGDFLGGAGPIIGYSGEEVDVKLQERTEALQEYEQERVADYQRIEATRAVESLAAGSYGTVAGSAGAYTGTWARVPGKPGNSCSVLYGSAYGSGTTRFFTGGYCREAEAQGLIDPFTG
jgi:hypothetical protein